MVHDQAGVDNLLVAENAADAATNDGVSGVNHYPLLHPSSCVMCRVG